jgi:asparagine synthase (glutamine-hydrolysing)
LLRSVPRAVRSLIATAARCGLSGGTKGRNTAMALAGTTAEGIAQAAVWIDYSDLARVSPWLARRLPEPNQGPRRWRGGLVQIERGLPGAAMAADFRSYLPEDILVKVDRASMLCSLEVRAPFLDQRIVDFAYRRVPNRLRVTLGERKILLKSLARRLLPPDLDIDRKQGFTIPTAKWLAPPIVAAWREECREQIQSVLADDVVSRLVKHRSSPAAEHSLYAMIMLTSWMHQYRISA